MSACLKEESIHQDFSKALVNPYIKIGGFGPMITQYNDFTEFCIFIPLILNYMILGKPSNLYLFSLSIKWE